PAGGITFAAARLDPYCDDGERPRSAAGAAPARSGKAFEERSRKPTRAKAARPDTPALDPSLADLLNPGIGQGRAGIGAQTGQIATSTDLPSAVPGNQPPSPAPAARPLPTGERQIEQRSGLQPPPDNSWDRRADFAQAHRGRASVARGFGEPPQQGYVGRTPVAPGELDPDLARALGIEEEEEQHQASSPPSAEGGQSQAEGERGGVI